MFRIGNYWIDEILRATLQDRKTDNLIGTLDELNSASIEVSSDPTEIVDHKGNVVRRVYRSKSATFTATSAYLNTIAQNLGSGSDIEYAAEDAKIEMPKMDIIAAGGSLTLENAVAGTIHVQGLFANGGNGDVYTQGTAADQATKKFGYNAETGVLTVPAKVDGDPIEYLVLYTREVESGMVLKNEGDKFPSTMKMTLFCSYLTPCDDFAPCYVYIPSFQPSPATTVSLDSETQTMDFNGDIQLDTCGTDKLLYAIYFPEENLIETAVTE